MIFIPRAIVFGALSVMIGATDGWASTQVNNPLNYYINGRYRIEHVDQNAFANKAEASTLRVNFGLTGTLLENQDTSFLLELQNITAIGSERYDSSTNGNTQYPLVADPEGTELNQLAFKFNISEKVLLTLGRQSVALDNQRFIGSVGWRQNDQTFDGVLLTLESSEYDKFTYMYINNVNRIFGDDHPLGDYDSDNHLLNWQHKISDDVKLSIYGYLLDIKNSVAVSSATYGLLLTGQQGFSSSAGNSLHYHIEVASQSDYADNPSDFSLAYWSTEVGMHHGQFAWALGREVLEGENGRGFGMPLATLHKYNGWADLFLATPGTGLNDSYLQIEIAKILSFKTILVHHRFSAEDAVVSDITYGRENDLMLSRKIAQHFDLTIKYADYRAKAYAGDVEKIWLVLGFAY